MKNFSLVETLTGLLERRAPSVRVDPAELFATRAQNVTNFAGGGALVPTQVLRISDALRPASTIIQAGAEVIAVTANQGIPAITSGCVGSWLSESAQLSETSVAFNSLSLAPKRCSAFLRVGKQLLRQAPELAEATLRKDLFAAIGQAFDTASFFGLGVGGEPLGLIFASGTLLPVTFGGAAVWADVVEFEEALANSFGEQGSLAWVSSPATRKKWRTIESFTGSGKPLWPENNLILNRPAFATAAIADNKMVYGNFADWLIALFSVEIISDEFSSKKEFVHEFVVNLMADCGALRLRSFSRSTDSAAQP